MTSEIDIKLKFNARPTDYFAVSFIVTREIYKFIKTARLAVCFGAFGCHDIRAFGYCSLVARISFFFLSENLKSEVESGFTDLGSFILKKASGGFNGI